MTLLGQWPGGRVDQVGLLTSDLHATMDAYITTLGLSFHVIEVDETNSAFSGSSATFRTRIAVALAGLSSVELIQPVAGSTIHSEHLRTRGPGLHHLGIYVPKLADAAKALAGRGAVKLMEGHIDRLGQFAYFQDAGMQCIIEPLQLSAELPVFLAQKASAYP